MKKAIGEFSPRRICGCIHQGGHRLGLDHGYFELGYKSVSGNVRKTRISVDGSHCWDQGDCGCTGGKHTPFSFSPEEYPHPSSYNFEEHEQP